MKKFIVLSLIIVAYSLVTGCAGITRPNMSESEARKAASAAKIIYGCMQAGYIDANMAATGKIILQQRMSRYNVDQDYLVNLAKTMPVEISLRTCNDLALEIAEYQQKTAINRQNAQSEPQYQYSAPKRTVCNNIAGQVLCSTY